MTTGIAPDVAADVAADDVVPEAIAAYIAAPEGIMPDVAATASVAVSRRRGDGAARRRRHTSACGHETASPDRGRAPSP